MSEKAMRVAVTKKSTKEKHRALLDAWKLRNQEKKQTSEGDSDDDANKDASEGDNEDDANKGESEDDAKTDESEDAEERQGRRRKKKRSQSQSRSSSGSRSGSRSRSRSRMSGGGPSKFGTRRGAHGNLANPAIRIRVVMPSLPLHAATAAKAFTGRMTCAFRLWSNMKVAMLERTLVQCLARRGVVANVGEFQLLRGSLWLRQTQTMKEAGVRDGDVLYMNPIGRLRELADNAADEETRETRSASRSPVGRPAGRLARRSAGRLARRSAGRLARRSAGRRVKHLSAGKSPYSEWKECKLSRQ